MTAAGENLHRIQRPVLVLSLFIFGAVVARNAWLSDDAYITFRTVDNFVHGYGLTWNPAERVQAYTHPLWMFVVATVYFFTCEAYYTSLFLSMTVSVLAVGALAWRGACSPFAALLAVLVLTLSKAFVDYSTSGLENPLTHLILVVFLLVYFRAAPGRRRLFLLTLLTALGATNRMDVALLFLPMLVFALFKTPGPWRGRLRIAAWGFLPFILWELFALVYYGFFFPNTAYAKLNLGLISRTELLEHGLRYFANSWRWDPLTLSAIVAGCVVALWQRDRRALFAVAGVLLYLLYLLWIGGDFMSGRFFAAPLLLAVAVLMQTDLRALKAGRWALLAAVVGIGLVSPYSPVRTDGSHGAGTDAHGITDEKGNYWSATALFRTTRDRQFPDHDWAHQGRAARADNPGIVQKGSIGFYGYFAGPDVHVVDLLALADPLLARLPPVDPIWSIGHWGRRSPEGYIESLATGENRIAHPTLAFYYDRLALVTRGRLFDPARLKAIWQFNTGAYDHYLDAYARFEGDVWTLPLRLTNTGSFPYVFAYVWNNGAAEAYLLDDTSGPGQVYSVTWTISARSVGFAGNYVAHTSSIGPLSDETTLNVGLILSPGPELINHEIFEHRYWFRLRGDRLLVARQGMGWHNENASDGWWFEADAGVAIERK